jgi:hypothetical protein
MLVLLTELLKDLKNFMVNTPLVNSGFSKENTLTIDWYAGISILNGPI